MVKPSWWDWVLLLASPRTAKLPARIRPADVIVPPVRSIARRPRPGPPAADQLRQEARSGRLDHEAVEALLEAVGQARRLERQTWPAGLSDREVEVLRLLARGKREKEIGGALFISTNTVHHHVKQIYEKAGVSTRAGAALFAMEHDLVLR